MSRRLARALATVAGWLAVVIGLAHLGLTGIAYDRPSLDALWFAGSGLAVMLIGAITLIARDGLPTAVVIAANAAGLGLAVAFGILTDWREPQGPLLTVAFVLGGAGAWSVSRHDRAQRHEGFGRPGT